MKSIFLLQVILFSMLCSLMCQGVLQALAELWKLQYITLKQQNINIVVENLNVGDTSMGWLINIKGVDH